MTSFTFDPTVPAGPNNPSNDQPVMQSNNVSSLNILAVDHITYNSSGTGAGGSGGHHKWVTFDDNHVPVKPTDPQSILYTNVGVSAASHPQLFWQNSQAIFQTSAIRAWAFLPSAAAGIPTQSINISEILHPSAGVFNVTLVTNSVNGTGQFGVLVSLQSPIFVGNQAPMTSSYIITGAATFTLNTIFTANGALADPSSLTFQVLQI